MSARAERSAAHRARMKRTQRRNARIVALYREGDLSQREIAERFGLTAGRVSAIIGEQGARDRALVSAALSRRTREQWARGTYEGANLGRPAVWPDVPPEVEADYRRLYKRYRIPAVEARRMLEGRWLEGRYQFTPRQARRMLEGVS